MSKKKATKKTGTPSEKPKEPAAKAAQPEPSKTSSTADAEEPVAPGQMDAVLQLLKPLTDFHKALEGATEDDVRLFWDVRAVRGKDTPFAVSKGVSTMPGLLSPKMKANASAAVQNEIVEKVGAPLTAAFQAEGERQNAAALEQMSGVTPPPSYSGGGGDKVLEIADDDAEDDAEPEILPSMREEEVEAEEVEAEEVEVEEVDDEEEADE